jgi:arylsulfatase A-like enzyme
MDIFPTLLKAAGGDLSGYELDGRDILPVVADGKPADERTIFWEMGPQNAVRRGNWKLVLKGQLVEGAPPEDEVHLSDLSVDMSEQVNLCAKHPKLVEELTAAANAWRRKIEERWTTEFAPR